MRGTGGEGDVPPFDVFLSHNSRDKPAVERIGESLKRGGIEPWLDKWHLIPGGQWHDELGAALRACGACAIFVGPHGLGDWAREELAVALNRAARDRSFRLFLVLLPGLPEPFDATSLPPFLSTRTWIDLRTGVDDPRGLQSLIHAVKGIPLGSESVTTRDTDVCPYRGLNTFGEEHADLFFGRDAEIQRLLEKLKASRLLAVLGSSGSGKSSLVRAGLIPALRRGALPGSETWVIETLVPGAQPLAALAAHVLRLHGHGAMTATLDELRADPRALHLAGVLALADRPSSARVMWVIDQFEEVFTLCRDDGERAAFVEGLVYAAAVPDGRTVVALTMRADFYPKCAAYPQLAASIGAHQFLVGPMQDGDLRQAIEAPARRVGLELETGLIPTILEDVARQPGALPLLQHALLELWGRRRGTMLTLEGYRESGGVEGAIARRADALHDSFTPARQAIARSILLRLTQPGEGTEDTRRRATLDELTPAADERDAVERVVGQLCDARLLTISGEAGMSERWVDVSHEALIRGWPRLRGWIEEDRAGLRIHRRLTQAAEEWHKHRDDGALYRGVRLAQATEWRDRTRPRLNDLERAFVDASIALERHEAAVRDQRRRRIVVWLSVSLIVFAILGGAAGLQWRRAVRQGQIALARQLSAQAVLMRNQPEMQFRRLALAAEAMARLHAVDAQSLDVDLALRGEVALVPRHLARVPVEYWHQDVRLSPDGAHLITGDFASLNGRVWAIDSGKELVRFDGGPAGSFTATRAGKVVRFQMGGGAARNHMTAFSGDARYVVTEAYDGLAHVLAQVWDTATGKQLLRVDLPAEGSYVLGAEGRYLAVSTEQPAKEGEKAQTQTQVWDVLGARQIRGSAPGGALALSEEGRVLATSQGMWEIADELKLLTTWGFTTWDVVLAGDGSHAAISLDDQQTIDVRSKVGKSTAIASPIPKGSPLAVSQDGRFVILKTEIGGGTEVFEVAGTWTVSRTTVPTKAAVVSPAGEFRLASRYDADSAVDIWTLGREGGAALAIVHGQPVVAVGVTALGVVTTITEQRGTLTIDAWNVKTGKAMPERHAQLLGTGAVFAPDGVTFAAIRESGVEVRRADVSEPVATFAYPGTTAVVWSPDGRYLAAQHEREVRLWDIGDGRSLGQLTLPGTPTALALGARGESLAAVVSSGKLTRAGEVHLAKVWNVSTAEELTSFEPDQEKSIHGDTHCALGHDAKYMVTNDLTVLEMTSGAPRVKLGADPAHTAFCVIAADGQYLATPSPDGLRIWDLTSGRETFRIPTFDRPLVFDLESRYVATIGGEPATVRVWFLRQEDLIDQACQRLPRNLSEAEWREYGGAEAYRETCPRRQ